ncbi:MAG: PIG-L deacetylase family protein [Hydrogenophaga sp.]|uniref:PIG-L deacetylase family protein n=1 Tax=Hydrogenophaga sp. TaxID=1904254 RepID=UPI003D150A53
MMPLRFASDTPRVLCLGAHSDDIEIGCAGTLLEWRRQYPCLEICWVVMSAAGERAAEARKSVRSLLGASVRKIELGHFPDGHLPSHYSEAKAFLAGIRDAFTADVVLTHRMEDRHQDHRLIGEMTWQTWRDQWILEYEIPKYEGDLGQPNVYMPLSAASARRKVGHLMKHFGSQRSKSWFTEPVFEGLMQIRGVECRSASGFAEAFHARKMVLHGQN